MPKRNLEFHYDEWGVKGSILIGLILIGAGIGLITGYFAEWLLIGIGTALASVGFAAVCLRR